MYVYLQALQTTHSLMVPSSLRAVILFLLLLAVRATRAELKTVSPNPDCDSSSTNTLDKELQNITSDNLIIALTSGVHCLLNPTVVQSVSNITLIGPDNTSAIITCTKNTGLAFLNISMLHLVNLHIRGCGLSRDNLMQVVDQTLVLVQLNFNIPNGIQVAVYAADVTDLHMEQVSITNTTGIGLVGINIVGECQIQSCQFSHNIQKQHDCGTTGHFVTDVGERIGGGAYFLFQDFIGDDITTCKNTDVYSFHIDDSHFLDNSDCSDLPNEEFILCQKQHFIGGGGGIGVVLAQVCYSVNITATSTVFEDNSATHGSGANVAIFQGVSNTHVEFEDCQFSGNGVLMSTTNLSFTTHGGAIGVVYDLVSADQSVPLFIPSRNISLKVKNSNFTDNVATKGGAVIITSLATSAVAEMTDVAYFYFDNCIFTANRAIHGAAALLTELKFSGRALGIQIWMANLTVFNNTLESLEFIAPVVTVDSVAVFEVQAINITLAGSCLFDSNTGTAFKGQDSVIGIAGEVKFSNNWWLSGGAVNLNGLSYFVVLPNSSLEFFSNSARIYGGAVYVSLIKNCAILPNFDCFLYFGYDQYECCENCDFSTKNFTVSFINNTADVAGGSIYGSALMSCPWVSSLQIDSNENILQVLEQNFSDHFVFIPDPIGRQNIQTSIAKVEIDASTDGSPYTVAPGEMRKVVIQPMDALGQSIPAILGSITDQDAPYNLSVQLDSRPIKVFLGDNINASTTLTIFGQENASGSLIIYAQAGSGLSLLSTKVHLTECPFGFQYSISSRSCECKPNLLERGIRCNLSDLTLSVPSGMWVGPLDDGSGLAVAHCIRTLCQPGVATISVSNSTFDFDQQCRPGLHRGGLLCSSCKEDYSNVFGGIRCRKCTNNSIAIILLFLVLGVLLIVFLVVFRVNISTGYLNGIIFWCNIVSLYKEVLVPGQSYLGLTFLANWLTLNWGIETCFHVGMSAFERSWWQLCFSIYLFILMALIRCIFKCCKNVDSKTAFSTIQAIATLLIMCYISILQFCIEPLSFARIYTEDGKILLRWRVDPTMEYFTSTHGILVFMACLLLVLYILPFPIILLFPTVLYKSKWLHKYKPIYDAFWYPLKPQYRFWLGARLMFRWLVFFMAFLYPPPKSTFVSAFFLLVLLFLQMQLQPFHSKTTNTLDSAFILSLLLLFLGSLFAESQQQHSWKGATGYSLALIVLTYLGIGAVFLYHLYSQFPKLRGFISKYVGKCKQKKRIVVLRVPQSAPEDPDSISGDQEESRDDGDKQPRLRVVGYTSFREPLLDEGSVEIETYTTSVPTSINTATSDTN